MYKLINKQWKWSLFKAAKFHIVYYNILKFLAFNNQYNILRMTSLRLVKSVGFKNNSYLSINILRSVLFLKHDQSNYLYRLYYQRIDESTYTIIKKNACVY